MTIIGDRITPPFLFWLGLSKGHGWLSNQPTLYLAQVQGTISVLGWWCCVRWSTQTSPLGSLEAPQELGSLEAPQRNRHRVHQVSRSSLCSCKLPNSRRLSFSDRVWTCLSLPPAMDGTSSPWTSFLRDINLCSCPALLQLGTQPSSFQWKSH